VIRVAVLLLALLTVTGCATASPPTTLGSLPCGSGGPVAGASSACSTPATTVPTAPATPSPGLIGPAGSGTGLTRDQAITIARAAAPRRGDAAVLQAEVGRFADLGYAHAASGVSPPPTPERLVWRVNLGTVRGPLEGEGTIVILDFQTGKIIQVFDWIS
jgi:hypothetical protein